ncbi:MAG: pyridoxal phosphate-dependent aminotransferase [Planctomycetota bacterium]
MTALTPSTRARAVTDSITLAITARAQAMRAQGTSVISLAAGEPDFPSPDSVCEAGIAAIRNGQTRYTPAPGMPDVRAAAAHWFRRHFGLEYTASHVMVTAGAKPALLLALMTLCEDGDPVLLPAPFWASYTDLVGLAGGRPVVLPAVPEQGFIHSGAQVGAAMDASGARGVMLNWPNNPSGAVPTREQVESVVAAVVARDGWIISDEIYARLIYDGLTHWSPACVPGAMERTLVVNGGTKSHSMTGWRVGFLAGPQGIIEAAGRVQSQAIGNTCTISQRAVLAVCNESNDEEVSRRIAAYVARRERMVELVRGIPGLTMSKPQGAFYGLIDAREVCARRGMTDIGIAESLLEEAHVAVVPGTPFAIEGFLRLSYAAAMPDIEEGIRRISRWLA